MTRHPFYRQLPLLLGAVLFALGTVLHPVFHRGTAHTADDTPGYRNAIHTPAPY